MEVAEQHGVEIYFYEKCTAIGWEENEIEFENTLTGNTTHVNADLIFGADGAFSGSKTSTSIAT